MKQLFNKTLDWLDERYPVKDLIKHAQEKTVPVHKGTIWYFMGGVCLFLFLIQVATGILLLMYYRVGTDASYESVKFITSKVEFGWLIRSLHSWTANFLVFFVFVHMFSVFFMKSYQKPREITWFSGFILLSLMMGFGFSGYLLPWNELAFFATKVGTEITAAIPIVGKWLLKILRGGEDVTGYTLSRFFGLHAAILPAVTTIILGIHLLLIQIQGIHTTHETKHMKFFPDFVMKDLILWLAVLNVLAVFAVFFPWELGEKADTFKPAPLGVKPEWYFLWAYQILKILPAKILFIEGEVLGVIAMSIGGLLWFLVPFLHREEKYTKLFKVAGWVIVIYIAIMTIWGKLS